MDKLNQRCLHSFESVGQHDEDNPLTPAIPRATTLFAELKGIATAMHAQGGDQSAGNSLFRGGADERRIAFKALYAEIRPMNMIAVSLDPEEFPGIYALFRLPRSRSYENILNAALAFAENAAGKEAIFTDRGLPTGFRTALVTKIAAITGVGANRASGLNGRAGATAGLAAKRRRGLAIVRELNGIMKVVYRDNPTLLASWRAAKRVPRTAPAQRSPEPPGSGTGGSIPQPTGS